jgi:hypothetical protein
MQCKIIGFEHICIALFLGAVHDNLVNCCLRVVLIGVNFVCNVFFVVITFYLTKKKLNVSYHTDRVASYCININHLQTEISSQSILVNCRPTFW